MSSPTIPSSTDTFLTHSPHSDVVPDSHKSTTQSATDKISREKDTHTGTTSTGTTDESLLDKAKHLVGADKK